LTEQAATDEQTTAQGEITCLIVDDHEVVREGLRLSLSRAPHIRVVGEAADGVTCRLASRAPQAGRRDHGRAHAGNGRARGDEDPDADVPETAVLIFTAYSERSLLGRGLESAPRATSSRSAAPDPPEGDRQGRGRRRLRRPGTDAGLPLRRPRGHADRPRAGDLQLLADGMSNADVAGRLFISQETVKSHVRHILTKLEADTRTHAVAIALRDAVID
jgi:DNA-binding NarL/FixJ family response regulator